MTSSRPQVVVIAGPNGAGKSTLAPYLLKDAYGVMEYVTADPIALGLSNFRPEEVALQAGRIMRSRLRSLAKLGLSFGFETTLAARSYVPWLSRLRQFGYDFHLLFLWLPNPDLAVQRVTERVRVGGHAIEELVIRRRYNRGLENFFRLYKPLATTWAVYNNESPLGPSLIAKGFEGAELIVYDSDQWSRFRRVVKWQ